MSNHPSNPDLLTSDPHGFSEPHDGPQPVDAMALPGAPIDVTPELMASDEFSPEALLAASAKAAAEADALASGTKKLRRLDPKNPRDKFILDITGDPASICIFGEMKTGKTTMLARACPNYLWIVHSKSVLRAYANMMRSDESLPALKFVCVPENKRDPKTGVVTRTNVHGLLMQILGNYNQIREKQGIEGIVIVEITRFMQMLKNEAEDINMHPEHFVTKRNPGTGQSETVLNFFDAGNWCMKFLMYLFRAAPQMIGAHVVMEANRRPSKFDEKLGITHKGGAQFLTNNQAVSAGHEADFMWEVRHAQDRASGEFKIEIATRGDDLTIRGGRDGALCDAVEPGDLKALMEKVGLSFAE